MKSFFSGLTRLSLRFRAITFILGLLVSVAGVIAVTQLKQELIPAVAFPQTTIFAQTSGLTSDQVLHIITERVETALRQNVPEINNLESTTTGSFGAIITAYNDFGLNQTRLHQEIQNSIDSVWLPLRRIQPPNGVDGATFAAERLRELPADVLIYLQGRDSNFLFQLSPDVWSALSPDTVRTLVSYLAGQSEVTQSGNPLRQLIDQEISPALVNLPDIARVDVSGGQLLPGEGGAAASTTSQTIARSLLLKLSPEVWQVVSAAVGYSGALDSAAAQSFAQTTVTTPTTPPALPQGWLMDHFNDASDLAEMRTLTRTIGAVFNDFVTSGRIVGSLGQTDDLTPDTIQQMLALDPTIVNAFKADQLAAMSDDVFAALPDDFIAGLDGLTRDQLAARALAVTVTGQTAAPTPVDLPAAWRIAPPQLITFSFDDLPLATFSVAGTGSVAPAITSDTTGTTPTTVPATAASTGTTAEATPEVQTIPEGPALPPLFTVLGASFGIQLNTADDLINLQLPASAAAQFGSSTLPPAQMFNLIALLANPSSLPAGFSLPIAINPAGIIGSISPDVFTFIQQYDPTFLAALSPAIYNWMSDAALSVPEIAPPLDTVWNTLANQPQFAQAPLHNAQDVIALGNGSAAQALNTINDTVPQRFAGYEVRLFNSLTPGTLRYFALQEPDFFTNLHSEVLLKMSPEALAILPQSVLSTLPADVATQITSIANGQTPSAADALASRYASTVPPADPNAPALNSEWGTIANFMGIELNSADDLFRFLPNGPAAFFNSLFDSPAGTAFAPGLFGGWTPDIVQYLTHRDATIWDNVSDQVLTMIPADAQAALPQAIQDRISSGAVPFQPTDPVTRTDGLSSMFVTIYKAGDANTVEAYHQAADVMARIDANNPNITVAVGFEQSSFIEESISGVAREGGLGAIFAVLVILVFLSGGAAWRRGARARVGAVIAAIFLVALGVIVLSNAGAYGGDLGAAFNNTDTVVRVLLILGIVIGLFVSLWPGKLPRPAWRSTLVTAVSIPLSVLMAIAFMRWIPPAVHTALSPAADTSPLINFLLHLFPASITLNIMTLSGLTVAIGRVVDDSIVVLENIFRQIQEGGNRREAVIKGVRDVSVAIFAATVITVVVFLPLGLTGGIISEFFLPFGLAVTYSLAASFIVAVTVVPVLAYLLLDENEISHEHEQSWLERIYQPILKWVLSSGITRAVVLIVALVSMVIGFALFAQRPQTFLPSFGEPQLSVAVSMPNGTSILQTNDLATQFENYARTALPQDEVTRVQTIVGSSGFTLQSLLGGGSSVSENVAAITLYVHASADQLNELTRQVRTEAETLFGTGNVTVSAASISQQGLGGFEIVLSGPLDDLRTVNQSVIDTLNGVAGLANVTSNLNSFASGGSDSGNTPVTYSRVNGQTAVTYTGELETQNTLGVTNNAIQALRALPTMPTTISISQGFTSDLQTQGFASVIKAMGIAVAIVLVILIITFGSLFHWIDIMASIIVAPVGAAIMLTLTNRVLGISALIGLLMLIGIVVTNAVVLIDRVQANRRERKMGVVEALEEAGDRRLRPILMTAIATIIALVPLTVGLSQGAIIASELGTVVIGGLFSSTLLTLIVVPVLYSIVAGIQTGIIRLVTGKKPELASKPGSAD